ncbi:MAG: PPOX class F420-dependent oxidoreductase [Dehalococcoidia bacterium]
MTSKAETAIPEKYQDLLTKPSFAHIATIGPKGEPQTTPVWIDWDGQHILFSQTKARQKFNNLGRDPRIALSMTDPENPYRYLEVRGVVEGVEDDPDNAFINKMAKKYIDQDVYPWSRPEDERVVVKVRPQHTTQMG